MWPLIAIYILGAIGTLAYNLHGMIYMSRPFVVARNAIFWPLFLPIVIVLKRRSYR